MQINQEFEAVYMQYSDKIYRFLYWHTKDARLSEDLTSEVFIRVWKNWKKFKQDYTQAWIYKIANNILIDHWRKDKNKKDLSLEKSMEDGFEPSYDEDLIDKIEKDEKIKIVNIALDKLPENLKKVVILRFIEELSAKEAAEIIGTTEVNIRVLQYRALVKLKEVMKDEKNK